MVPRPTLPGPYQLIDSWLGGIVLANFMWVKPKLYLFFCVGLQAHVYVPRPTLPGPYHHNMDVWSYPAAQREILLARIRNPIFVQASLKEKVPGNIKNTTEKTGILVPDPG